MSIQSRSPLFQALKDSIMIVEKRVSKTLHFCSKLMRLTRWEDSIIFNHSCNSTTKCTGKWSEEMSSLMIYAQKNTDMQYLKAYQELVQHIFEC